jgi:hypothetical protein
MAYVTPEYVNNLQKTHNAVFWKVTDASGKLTINSVIDTLPLVSSQELLQDTLKDCQGDYVLVRLYTNKPARIEKGDSLGQIFDLRVKLENPGRIGETSPRAQSSNGFTFAEFMAMQNTIKDKEMELFKMELQAKENSPLTRVAERLLENDALINGLLGVLLKIGTGTPAAPLISQAPISPGNINEAVNSFAEVDPDYVNTLNKMAAYIKQNPTVLGQIKNIIN